MMIDDLRTFLAAGGVDTRAQFVVRFFGVTSFTSTTFGLVAGNFGVMLFTSGPLIPFFAGSIAGYVFGVVSFWRQEKARALEYAALYPNIMEHVLSTQFSHVKHCVGTRGNIPMVEWLCSGGVSRMSWGILAAQSCRASVLELQEDARQKLVESYKENPPAKISI
ncbi:hypothetical protein T484DRAFT_1929552 [Baffinella frigidus]|jgi:hypothetical protein|nr:hypothetical protein T484DRAFT_1929552 [Cryptophyta sp. CCMP2293]